MGYEDKVSNDPKTFIKHVYCCAVAEVKHNKHEVGTAAAVRDDWVLELELSTKFHSARIKILLGSSP